MAITTGTVTQSNIQNQASISFNHDSQGCDVLVVLVNTTNSSSTSATYNGVAMTKVIDTTHGYNPHLFYLVNPSSGSNSVVVSGGSGRWGVSAINLFGVDKSNPVGNDSYNEQDSVNSISTTISDTTPGSLILSIYSLSQTGSDTLNTFSSGETAIAAGFRYGNSGGAPSTRRSKKTVTTTSTQVQGTQSTSSQFMSVYAVEFLEAGGGNTGVLRRRLLLGF